MKLPLRGRRKLPKRSRRHRRLQFLKEYQPDRVYSFVPIGNLDDVPEELLLWAVKDVSDEIEPADDELDNDSLDDDEDDVERFYGHA